MPSSKARLYESPEERHPRSPWVALDSTVDRVRWARLLRRAHELALSNGATPSILRGLVARSWRRATAAGVDPDGSAPKLLDSSETAKALAAHPVAHLLSMIEDMLAEATEDARHFAAFGDGRGMLLWIAGSPGALDFAAQPGFLPGHLCSEAAVGTNAVGTALELDHPVQIFSAEHYSRRLHGWTCAAAPIHDPETEGLLGVLDISGDFRAGHPHSLCLVSAVARVVEGRLTQEAALRDERLRRLYFERIAHGTRGRSALVSRTGRVLAASPRGWLEPRPHVSASGEELALPAGVNVTAEPIAEGARILWQSGRRKTTRRPRLSIEALGRDRVRVTLKGERFDLSPRHGEIAVLLTLNPEGLTAGELGSLLYGDGWRPVTVRAEISRLRRVLGSTLARNPYRLVADVGADFTDVGRLLEEGEVGAAVKRYTGRLLPSSAVPAIAEARQRIDGEVRSCALAAGDVDILYSWVCAPPGRDDRRAHLRLLKLLDAGDPRRRLIASRIEALPERR